MQNHWQLPFCRIKWWLPHRIFFDQLLATNNEEYHRYEGIFPFHSDASSFYHLIHGHKC